jgi:hypothetical protein
MALSSAGNLIPAAAKHQKQTALSNINLINKKTE